MDIVTVLERRCRERDNDEIQKELEKEGKVCPVGECEEMEEEGRKWEREGLRGG